MEPVTLQRGLEPGEVRELSLTLLLPENFKEQEQLLLQFYFSDCEGTRFG